jgi:DNA-directed RNA polymerase specialized sigma24 family protein
MRYSGFSYKEIADQVEVAATSVGTLLARAERRFAEALTVTGKAV